MKDYFSDILSSGYARDVKAHRIAAKICSIKNYSWVGIYDVLPNTISIIGCSDEKMPEHPSFPKDKGLNGRAVSTKKIVLVNDTSIDTDYMTFNYTQSEIIVPVFSEHTNDVIGTIDVESTQKNAFNETDILFLKECVSLIRKLWR